MSDMHNIQFHLSGHWWVLAALICLALFTTVAVYQRTNPPAGNTLRRLLMVLRFMALMTILLALYESRMDSFQRQEKPPLIAVAIDQSASMAINDADGPRAQHLHKALTQDLKQVIVAPLVAKYVSFDGAVHAMTGMTGDSLHLTGDATDITLALQSINSQLREQNLTAILLISDGNYNQGGNPVRLIEDMATPVFSVGVGSIRQPADLNLAKVDANPFAYIDEPTPILVTVNSVGYTDIRPTITLREANTVLASATVAVAASPSEQTATLTYTAKTEGRHKLVIQVSGQPGELATENNSRTLYIDVAKSRFLITLLAGEPTPEISFLSRALTANPRFRMQIFIQRKDGTLFTSDGRQAVLDSLDHTDILAVLDYPTRITPPAIVQQIETSWSKISRPFLLLAGHHTDFQKLARWQRWLPVGTEILQVNDFLASAGLAAAGQNHPIIQIANNPDNTTAAWNLLPPIWVHQRVKSIKPGSQILAVARGNESLPDREAWPLIVVRSDGMVNCAALLGSSLWRWSLMMTGIGNEDRLYDSLVNNLIRWLQMERKTELVNLTLNKTSYPFGEPVVIQVKVFDAQFQPVDGAQVDLVIQKQGEQKKFAAAPAGAGLYEWTYHPDAPGDHEINVIAEKNGHPYGTAKSLFSVGEYSEELAELVQQKEVLQNLSRASGGRYVPVDSLIALRGALPARVQQQWHRQRFELWNHTGLLLFIIACLAAEWWLRKWKGMI